MLTKKNIHKLNRDCYCFPLDREIIDQGFQTRVPEALEQCRLRENLFAGTGVLLDSSDVKLMTGVIETIESLVHSKQYLTDKLRRTPLLAEWQRVSGDGMIMSYDFHINDHGPKLIEVNTNAGGAFVIKELLSVTESVYPPCCGFGPLAMSRERLHTMLQTEWISSGREGAPGTAVIVDDNPEEQYLYPDMQIAKNYFEVSGVKTLIADTHELKFRNGFLHCRDEVVDIVYNRSTDFTLQSDVNEAMLNAALCGAALVAPNPFHHALYADKSNFIDWTDGNRQLQYELSTAQSALLIAHLPETRLLSMENAVDLYKERKRLFFKPVDGYGGKAVYRGDKITRGTWQQLLEAVSSGSRYIAQSTVAPTLRAVDSNGEQARLKYDVRIYTLGGEPLIAAARMYQGQTTNFRTEGGGLAPVYVWSDSDAGSINEGQSYASLR